MTSSDYSQVEKAILNRAQEILVGFLSRFEAFDLSFQGPTVDIELDKPGERTSELRIYFVRRGDVIDAIEFHIFEDGRQIVDEERVSEWLTEDIGDVLARLTASE